MFQGFQGILEIYIKILIIQFCSLPSYISLCKNLKKFQVSSLNVIFLPPTCVAILDDWRKLSKNFLIAFCPRFYANFGVCSSYGVRETLSGHERQTYGRIDFSADQEYIYFVGSHMTRTVTYIMPTQIRPFFTF